MTSGPVPPRLSVVVPSRHRPEALARCLAALAASDLDPDDFEVVVALDGEDVAAPDAPWVRVVRDRRGGPAAARNRGAAAARGAVLAFTDDDCVPEPDWARRMLERVEAAPDALVGGRFANGVPANRWAEATHLILDVVVAHAHRRGSALAFAVTANLAVRADVFRAIGGFDERFDRNAAEDRDFCARCLEAGSQLVLAPEAVVRHHHDRSALGFLRLHATYGQGAVTYQRARRARGRGLAVAPHGLYRALAGHAARQGLLGRVAASQAAYAAGVAAGFARR